MIEGPWTADSIQEFKQLYGTHTDAKLAEIFDRAVEDVKRLAERYCLSKYKAFVRKLNGVGASKMPRWTDVETIYLRNHYDSQSNLMIARVLGRSVVSVTHKASKLGLRKSKRRLQRMGHDNVALRRDRLA